MIDKYLLEAMALRSEIHDTLNRLRDELQEIQKSDDPKEAAKGRFFEELGLRFYASLEAGLSPLVAGAAAAAWVQEGSCDDEDCPQCAEEPSCDPSFENTERLAELFEEFKKAGIPFIILPGDDTVH